MEVTDAHSIYERERMKHVRVDGLADQCQGHGFDCANTLIINVHAECTVSCFDKNMHKMILYLAFLYIHLVISQLNV